ncbi:LPXTG cell wall anchor domain-containing protein, partial [bacterium]
EVHVPLNVAEAIVMVPQNGVKLKSDQLTDAGARLVQDVNLQLYSTTNLSPDVPLKLSLSGRPAQGAQVNSGTTTTLAVGIGAFVLVGGLAAVYFIRRRKVTEKPDEIQEEETPEALMDAIIALDDQRRAGELNEGAYLTRRSELKARLEKLQDPQNHEKGAE